MAREAWQQALKDSLTETAELAERFAIPAATLEPVIERYPLRITPYYLRLIEHPGDPIWRQCVPDPRELDDREDVDDPLSEEDLSPVPAVIHRYPDRAVFLVSGSCPGYCRFCTRKRRVGCANLSISFRELREGLAYLADTPQIHDVILSGGDPLVLPDTVLADLLERISVIRHVEIVRIGSRAPVTLPERITDSLCRLLKRYAPLYLNTHFNHPRELTAEAAEACARLANAGIVLGNQTVLLRGVNDCPEILEALFRGLLKMRVRPYYLHHMDRVRGTSHFRTPLQTGLEIMQTLRGPLSGLALPYYVVDLPGGKGKVPLLPEYLIRHGEQLCFRAPDGSLVPWDEPAL